VKVAEGEDQFATDAGIGVVDHRQQDLQVLRNWRVVRGPNTT